MSGVRDDETETRLARIEARANAAIEGPWYTNSYGGIFSTPRTKAYIAAEEEIPEDAPGDDPRWAAVTEMEDASHIAWMTKSADWASEVFIANARDDIPWLTARARELEAQVAWLSGFKDRALPYLLGDK